MHQEKVLLGICGLCDKPNAIDLDNNFANYKKMIKKNRYILIPTKEVALSRWESGVCKCEKGENEEV